jgi:hypothetical protein
MWATRLWWLLCYFGHDDTSVLDGGLVAWTAADGPVGSGESKYPPAILIYNRLVPSERRILTFYLSVIALNVSNLDYILHGTLLFIPNIIFAVVLRHSWRAGPLRADVRTESCSNVLFLAL